MSPKSLLRHKLAVSTLEDLTNGQFQPVIGEQDDINPKKSPVFILCAGKVYYDLLEARRQDNLQHVAIARLEQLYPFPDKYLSGNSKISSLEISSGVRKSPKTKVPGINPNITLLNNLQAHISVTYAGREASAAPAVGKFHVHIEQQKAVVQAALYGNPFQENNMSIEVLVPNLPICF